MKVLFIYPNLTGQEYLPMGLALISSAIKQHGHTAALMDYTWGGDVSESLKRVHEEKPDIVAISTYSGVFRYVVDIAKCIKKEFDVPIILGGPHPTVAPEETIAIEQIDMLCVGEGEEAFCELLTKIEGKEDISNIKNIWLKKEGEIFRNEVRELKENLDELPFPDRELFDFERYLKARNGMVDVITGRGCPYQCTFCINPYLQDLYSGKGKFVRKRSVRNLLAELSQLVERYEVKSLSFHDDVFVISRKWLRDFAESYSEKIGLPYGCNARVETIDEEITLLLKKTNCVSVGIGIESGSEKIRKEVLKRPMSDEKIINAFKLVSDAGIATYSFNMVGIPHETEEDIQKTIELNRRVRPSSLQVSIFQPFPGTELEKIVKEKKWFKKRDLPISHKFKSLMDYPQITKKEIEKSRIFFRFNILRTSNLFNATLFLLFDIFFASYTKLRSKIPLFLKSFLFKVEGIIGQNVDKEKNSDS